MKKGTVIILFVIVCAVMLQLAGCSKEEVISTTTAVPIRIVAETSISSHIVSRSQGNFSGSAGEWKEKFVGAEAYEVAIRHIFLFVYKRGGSEPVKVIFYYPRGTANPLEGINGITDFEIKEVGTDSSSISLDLELKAGDYNFILLANCESILQKVLDTCAIPALEQMTEKTDIFTSDDLKGNNRKYLPMVGQTRFHVPESTPGGVRITIPPTIDLERVHTRIEFRLTTIDNTGGYLSPLTSESVVKKLTLRNESSGYSILPSNGEYTVTGQGNPDIKGVRYTDYLPGGISAWLPERDSFHEGSNDGATIGKYKDRLLPFTGGDSKYIYVAPALHDADKPLTLILSVATPGGTNLYEIPFYNPDLSATDKGYYDIRRNSIYRISGVLRGPHNIGFSITVTPWESETRTPSWE